MGEHGRNVTLAGKAFPPIKTRLSPLASTPSVVGLEAPLSRPTSGGKKTQNNAISSRWLSGSGQWFSRLSQGLLKGFAVRIPTYKVSIQRCTDKYQCVSVRACVRACACVCVCRGVPVSVAGACTRIWVRVGRETEKQPERERERERVYMGVMVGGGRGGETETQRDTETDRNLTEKEREKETERERDRENGDTVTDLILF